MERPRLRKASEIFITQRQPAGTKEKISFPFSPRPLVFVMYLLFPSVRLFFAVWRRQGERVFFSHCDCTGVQFVYCFRPRGMSAVTAVLKPVCFSILTKRSL